MILSGTSVSDSVGSLAEVRDIISKRTMVLNTDTSMIPAIVWDSTTIFLMIPAPPGATSIAVSKSGTLKYTIRGYNGEVVQLTITEVAKWSAFADGYAKIRLRHADTSPKLGPCMAYANGGTLTITFS